MEVKINTDSGVLTFKYFFDITKMGTMEGYDVRGENNDFVGEFFGDINDEEDLIWWCHENGYEYDGKVA